MKKRMLAWAVAAIGLAVAASAIEIPVTGPAAVGFQYLDLLEETVLEPGVLAVTPDEPRHLRIGDGVTKGGLEVRAKGCVTNFAQIAHATTNLNMHQYSIEFGDWMVNGDANALNFTWGKDEILFRLVRNSDQAFLGYAFSMTETNVFQFVVASTEDTAEPVLEVSTNLLEGFSAAPSVTFGTSRPDATHMVITYTNNDATALFFRVFAQSRMATGIYFDEPVVATAGIKMGTNTWSAWPDVGAIATNAANAAVSPVEARIGTLETNAAPWYNWEGDWYIDEKVHVDDDFYANDASFGNSITLGGVTRTNWPDGGETALIIEGGQNIAVVTNGDVRSIGVVDIAPWYNWEGDWYIEEKVHVLDDFSASDASFENSITLGGVTRTNWPAGDMDIGEVVSVVSTGMTSLAVGTSVVPGGSGSIAVGRNAESRGSYSMVFGRDSYSYSAYGVAIGYGAQVPSGRHGSFCWNGRSANSGDSNYNAKAEGSFCVNPQGGVTNFYIGSQNLSEIISSAVSAELERRGIH